MEFQSIKIYFKESFLQAMNYFHQLLKTNSYNFKKILISFENIFTKYPLN